MAAFRSKAVIPVGSESWISAERENALQVTSQDVEDFTFAARNDMEWLNEHMADIFTKDQFEVTEIFKTPGKLRWKTPRTARKRNPLEIRAPLTDVFASNAQTSKNFGGGSPIKPAVQFKVAEDTSLPVEPVEQNSIVGAGYDTDKENDESDNWEVFSGMDADTPISIKPSPVRNLQHHPSAVSSTPEGVKTIAKEPQPEQPSLPVKIPQNPKQYHDDEAYVSQNTNQATQTTESQEISTQNTHDSAYASQIMQSVSRLSQQSIAPGNRSSEYQMKTTKTVAQQPSGDDVDQSVHETSPQSDGSSPERPVIRKSSLNFASLPAREPLTTKKSIGARTSRTSQLEQSKANGPSRSSYYGRYQDGKSIGPQAHEEDVEDDDDDADMDMVDVDNVSQNETDGISKLHNKTSTQRLHDKISMLGQSHQPRPTKSIPSIAASQPNYPDLSQEEKQAQAQTQTKTRSVEVQPVSLPSARDDDVGDDESWIPSNQPSDSAATRPPLPKSHSTDVMEQITDKESIGQLDKFGVMASNINKPLPQSPVVGVDVPARPMNVSGHLKSASASITVSPSKYPGLNSQNHRAILSVSNPDLPSKLETDDQISYTPIGSPTSRKYADGPISASKAKLSSILKSARGIFASSAGVSAQAKLETLSPRTLRLRENMSQPSLETVFAGSPNRSTVSLYPKISSSLKDASRVTSASSNSSAKEEGRRTRGSIEREEKKREKEMKERQKVAEELEKARAKEAQRAAAHKLEKERVASQERQYMMQKEQEKKSKPVEQPPVRKSPRKKIAEDATQPVVSSNDDRARTLDQEGLNGNTAAALESSQPKPPVRRPMRPIKEMASKAKPVPVSIRVGTASQWEADHRKIGQVQPSTLSTSSNVPDDSQTAASRAPALSSKASSSSLTTNISTNTLKSSMTSSKPKALVMAAKKKEQEDREVQRKADLKREMDRKRAVQQEESRRQDLLQKKETERQQREKAAAQEETRKAAQKQALEKKRIVAAQKVADATARDQAGSRAKPSFNPTAPEKVQTTQPAQRGELAISRPPSRLNSNAPSRNMPENLSRSINQPPINPARPPKRVIQDPADEGSVHQPSKSGTSYVAQDAKRRRTNENAPEVYEPVRAPMAPPIRQSAIRVKDVPAKSMFAHGYTSSAQTPSMTSGAATIKSTTASQTHTIQQIKPAHPLDMAKFTNGKIPFAEVSSNSTAVASSMHKTPIRPAIPTAKSSPRYQNGELIELPEIATDSEDEDSENEFAVPDWAANSPIITDQLRRQDNLNPEEVFGPIAPLHMEEIFRNKDRHHRFRSRTSSANWSGQDRLTQDEIQRDMEARERLRLNGGWTYGL